jgi:LPXTG-motif cell wall-anchored protein
VTENIAIKAIWKRQGTFTIVYSDTSLDGEQGSLSPDIHDQNVYYDLAQAVAEKAATPPEGNYVFKGWRTPDGEIHQPGDLYTIKSDYAEPVEGQTETYTYTLTPIFEKLEASSLTYDVNGGSGILSNPGSAEKGCTTDTNALKNIVMDTAVTLSDGDGFTKPGYVLTGWNSNTDPNAADAIHFDLGGTYGISEKENTLYAEWTPVCFDLEFLKQGEELKEVTFESEYEPLNGAVFSLSGDGVSETATSATIDDHVGTVKFENVRPGDNSSLSLIETSAPTGYQKDDSTYTVTWETPKAPYTFITIDGVKYIQATGVSLKNADGDTVTEIINKRPFVSLTLYKVDSTDTSKKLDDAEFQLTRDNNGAASNYTRGDHVDGIYVTVNGEFVMDLADGEYTLTEKKPPEGYIITTNAYSFTVEDGVITGDDIDVDEDGNYLITVTNEPGVALPSTGGSGTNLIYLLGIMLTGIAGTGLVMKKRRRA